MNWRLDNAKFWNVNVMILDFIYYCYIDWNGHTIFNIVVLHMKLMKDGPGMGE